MRTFRGRGKADLLGAKLLGADAPCNAWCRTGMRPPPTPPRATFAIIALAAAVAVNAPLHAHAEGSTATINVRVSAPPSLPFEATALGRATHPIRLVISSSSTTALSLDPLMFRFRPVRDGVQFSCDDPQTNDERWPAMLEPGGSFVLKRAVACETPLPGRYDVEIRGRPRGGPDSAERTYGSFALIIEPGANAPVKLPWELSLHGAASGTKEMRPSTDPNAARVVVALINGTRAAIKVAPVRATMRVTRRGSTVPTCRERSVDLAFSGSLEPGRKQSVATPLGCVLEAESLYDIDIAIANSAGANVHLATHAIRVGVLPPPPPRPEDVQRGKVIGGM